MKLTNTLRDAFVLAAMQDVPSVDYSEKITAVAIKAAVEKLPPKVRAIWNDKELRGFVVTDRHWLAGSLVVCVPGKDHEVDKVVRDAAAPLVALDVEQRKSRESLQTKLRSVAYACTTRKALLDALPEFEKYLPADEAAVNRSMPVVAGVVTEFVKAGWPKGAKRKA